MANKEEIIKNLEESLKNPKMDKILRSRMERKLKEVKQTQIQKQ